MLPTCSSRLWPPSTMREREALVDAGIMPTSAHSAPSKLSRRRAALASTRRPWSSSSSWWNTSTSRLLTKAMSKASSTSACPWRLATAIQGTPPQSGHSGPAKALGCTAATNTSPRPAPQMPATATATETTATAVSNPGMRGQRPRSHQARAATPSAARACQAVRSSPNAPLPKPLRTCPNTMESPTPAAKPCVTEMGRKRATDARRNTPSSHWNTKASATVVPVTASTWRAFSPNPGAAPYTVASTAANNSATTVVGAYTTPARGAASVSNKPGRAADHSASAASEWSAAKSANASSPRPTAWGTVTAAADHAAAMPEDGTGTARAPRRTGVADSGWTWVSGMGLRLRGVASERARREGVAGLEAALLHAGAQPALALRTGAVGERLGHHGAAAGALQRVVADLRGRVHGFLHVALLQDRAGILGVVGPHTGETVGLQFQTHGQAVVFGLADAAAHLVHLGADAQQVLHVVAQLVGDHVGLGEVARRAEAALEGFVEAQIDVHLLVGRAVERPHGRLARAAGRGRGAAKQHQPRLLVAA